MKRIQFSLLLSCLMSLSVIFMTSDEPQLSNEQMHKLQEKIQESENPAELDTCYKNLDYSNHEALIMSIEDGKNCVDFYVRMTSGTQILEAIDPDTGKSALGIAIDANNHAAASAIQAQLSSKK